MKERAMNMRRRTIKQRILSFILTLAMVFSAMPESVLMAEELDSENAAILQEDDIEELAELEELSDIEEPSEQQTESKTLENDETIITASGDISIEEAFADAQFVAFIKDNYDSDSDGMLSADEISNVTSMNLTNSRAIVNLAGIQTFTSLEDFKYASSQNVLASADFHGMTSLKTLEIAYAANLNNVNIAGCTGLTSIDIQDTYITSIDLSDATELTSLTIISTCVPFVDISANTKLTESNISMTCNAFLIAGTESNQPTEIALADMPTGFDVSKVVTDSVNTKDNPKGITFESDKIKVTGTESIVGPKIYSGGTYKYDIGRGIIKEFSIGLEAYPSPIWYYFYADTINIPVQSFDGVNPVEPQPTITYTKKGVTETIDPYYYTLSYSNNTAPGTATMTVTSRYKFHGSKDFTFTILAGKPALKYDQVNSVFLIENATQLRTFVSIVNGDIASDAYVVKDAATGEVYEGDTSTYAKLTADVDIDDQIIVKKTCTIDLNEHKLIGNPNEFGLAILFINCTDSQIVTVKNGTIYCDGDTGNSSVLIHIDAGKLVLENSVLEYQNTPYTLVNAVENKGGYLTMNNCSGVFGAHFFMEVNSNYETTLNNCKFRNSYKDNRQVDLIQTLAGTLSINGGEYYSRARVVYATNTANSGSVLVKGATFIKSGTITGSNSPDSLIVAWVPLTIIDSVITGGNRCVYASSSLSVSGNTELTCLGHEIDTNRNDIGSYALYVEKIDNKTGVSYDISGGTFIGQGAHPYGIFCAGGLKVLDLLADGATYSAEGTIAADDTAIPGKVEVTDESTHRINYVIEHGTNNSGNPRSFTNMTPTITLLAPICDSGFTFAGWYTTPNFDEESAVTDIATTGDSDIKLYAKFVAKSIRIILNSNVADNNETQVITKTYDNQYDSIPIPCGFERDGFVFRGWAITSTATDPVFYSEDTVYMKYLINEMEAAGADSINLYAVWKDLTINLSNAKAYFSDGNDKVEYVASGAVPNNISVYVEDQQDSVDVPVIIYLTEGRDFDITCSNNTKLGKATAKIVPHAGVTGITGELAINYTVVAKHLSDATLTLAQNSYEYTGTQIKPELTLNIGSTTLIQGTDYTVSYSNNINVADSSATKIPTVTVKGKGNYTGTLSEAFAITPIVLDRTVGEGKLGKINVAEKYTYTGAEIKPAVKVTYELNGITKTVPTSAYTVSYENNINVGTATVRIVCKDDSAFSGVVTQTFAIEGKSLAKITPTLKYSSMTYTGADTKDENVIVVKDGKKVLNPTTDYDIHYEGDSTNVTGTGVKVWVTGKGNYSSVASKAKSYIIKAAKFKIVLDNTYFEYASETVQKPELTILDEAGATINSELFDIVYSNENSTEPGNYSIQVKPKSGNTNYIGTVTAKYQIGAKKSIEIATVTIDSAACVYNGKAQKPDVTVKIAEAQLTEGVDYSVSYKNNVNAGDNTAIVTITGKSNYSGTINKAFSISTKELQGNAVLTFGNNNAEYTGKKIDPKATVKIGRITLRNGRDYRLEYINAALEQMDSEPIEAGTYKIRLIGMGNYSTATAIENDFIVLPKKVSKLSFAIPKGAKYTDDTSALSVIVKDGKVVLTKDIDYTCSFSEITNKKATCTITMIEGSNYTGSISKTFSYGVANNALVMNATTFERTLDDDETSKNIKDNLNISSTNHIQVFTLKDVTGNATKNQISIMENGNYVLPEGFVGTVTIRVTAGDNISFKKVTKDVKLVIVPNAALMDVTNINGKKLRVTLSPLDAMHVTACEIKYSTKSNMSKAKIITCESMNEEGLYISDIAGDIGTRYYIQARIVYRASNNKKYYSEWTMIDSELIRR